MNQIEPQNCSLWLFVQIWSQMKLPSLLRFWLCEFLCGLAYGGGRLESRSVSSIRDTLFSLYVQAVIRMAGIADSLGWLTLSIEHHVS